jgi:hypothetical protein
MAWLLWNYLQRRHDLVLLPVRDISAVTGDAVTSLILQPWRDETEHRSVNETILIYEGGLIRLWLYKENNKLRD